MATRWRLGLLMTGALLASITSVPARAQSESYPTRPITVVVPFPAGGLTDVPARLAATLLQDKVGQGVVIENTGCEPLVSLRHFGPDVHQNMPEIGDHRKK